MTNDELIELIEQAIMTSSNIVRKTLPYGKRAFIDEQGRSHPGNLQNNAFKVIKKDDNSYDICIDLNIAPYADYINQPGYKTSGYWDKAAENIIKLIAEQLGGQLE